MTTVHAEISIIPITNKQDTSMSKEVAAAFEAISKIEDIKATLTPLGTQIESKDLNNILKAIRVAHAAAKSSGVQRIISNVRIDERLDKDQTLKDKVNSVYEKLNKQS
jgi:uncharacterized protein (TIGR00106 family)